VKAQSSRLTLRLSIYVTSAAILSILVNLSANLLSNKSLNTSWYYALIIILGAASAVFGLLQILPVKQQKQRAAEQHDIIVNNAAPIREDLLSDLVLEDIRQQALVDLFSKLTDLPPKQRQAISASLSDLIEKDLQMRIERLVKTQKENFPIKVTTEIDGIPITIETPDVEKAGDIVDLMAQRIQSTSALASEKNLQQSVVKEGRETYKTEINPE
jgi:hypothetical protein